MKRRFLVSVSVTGVLAGSLAVPAAASFDPHFKVIAKTVHAQERGNGRVTFYEKLIDPHRLQDKVGHDHGVCKPDGPVAVFCKATFHLSGEIGGHGDISVAGKLFQGKNSLKVVDGTDAFEGARGTVTLEASDLGGRYAVQIFDLR